MKRKWIWAVIIPVALILIIGGWILMMSLLGGAKYKKASLESCSISTGGGMMGGYSTITLQKSRDGNMTLEVRSKRHHADRERITTYPAEEGDFERVRDIVNEYGLYRASKRPRSPIEVMDGETTSYRFYYDAGSFYFSSNQMLTSKMSEGIEQLEGFLLSLTAREGETTLEPQQATLYLKSGYTLNFIVQDAFDGKLTALQEEREVSRYEESGIVLASGIDLDTAGGDMLSFAEVGVIVYDPGTGQVILLYKDHEFDHEVCVLAILDHYASSAAPYIEEMEGSYRLFLSGETDMY